MYALYQHVLQLHTSTHTVHIPRCTLTVTQCKRNTLEDASTVQQIQSAHVSIMCTRSTTYTHTSVYRIHAGGDLSQCTAYARSTHCPAEYTQKYTLAVSQGTATNAPGIQVYRKYMPAAACIHCTTVYHKCSQHSYMEYMYSGCTLALPQCTTHSVVYNCEKCFKVHLKNGL